MSEFERFPPIVTNNEMIRQSDWTKHSKAWGKIIFINESVAGNVSSNERTRDLEWEYSWERVVEVSIRSSESLFEEELVTADNNATTAGKTSTRFDTLRRKDPHGNCRRTKTNPSTFRMHANREAETTTVRGTRVSFFLGFLCVSWVNQNPSEKPVYLMISGKKWFLCVSLSEKLFCVIMIGYSIRLYSTNI